MVQVVQEEINKAARLVEQSIADGQPVAFAHTKPVTDLLNEVGTGDWQYLQAGPPAAAGEPLGLPCSHKPAAVFKGWRIAELYGTLTTGCPNWHGLLAVAGYGGL